MKSINSKRNTVIACFVIYILVNVFLMICNYGAYSTDEFYSLGSANLAVNTVYDRALYINGLVRLLSEMFGSSYYVFKMIPLTAGFVGYCCVMYMTYKISSKTSTILIVSLAITFNALILFNHLYIRHYVFCEMAYILSMLFLYKYAQTDKNRWIRFVYLGLFIIPNYLYYKYTNDQSGTALIAITIVTFAVVILQNYVYELLCKKSVWIITIVAIGGIEVFVILLKKQMINHEASLKSVYGVLSFYQTDIFVFVLFLIFAYSAIVISILEIVIRLFKTRFENRKILLLTIYTVIPMAAYFLFFFNNSLLRSYTSYMLAGFAVLAYYIDKINNKIWKKVLVVLIAINTIFTYYPFPNGIVEFWHDPMIRKEVYIRDYQGWLDEAKKASDDGYIIVPMMTLLDEEYYFEFGTTESLTLLDEDNQTIFTDDEIVLEFERLRASGNKYVVMVDTVGRDALIRVGLYDMLKEEYRHTIYYDKWYDDGMSIFYIE